MIASCIHDLRSEHRGNRRACLALCLGLALWSGANSLTVAGEAESTGSRAAPDHVAPEFVNPVYEGADPWIARHDGHYYLCRSEQDEGVSVWKSDSLTDPGAKRVVWNAPRRGWNSRQIWAPELHRLRGRWYIYYAASDGRNENHRMGVLEATTDDPQGPYVDKGMLYTGDDAAGRTNNRWAIDATPLEIGDQLYLVWSGWPDTEDVQYLYIAPMENPWTISGNRVRLCDNATYDWERVGGTPAGRGLNEGPQILRTADRVCIVYSCSGSWEPTYKLGLLHMAADADPLDPASWTKADRPVFQGTDRVFGVGHACFVKSPDGSEEWIVYHSKTSPKHGWERVVNMQPFRRTTDGFPDFGEPVPPGRPLRAPSGERPNRPGGDFVETFDSGNWDRWQYYGSNRYIWVDSGALSLGGHPVRGLVNHFRTGEKALVRGAEWSNLSVQARIRVEQGERDAGILFRVRYPSVGYDAQRGYFAGIIPGTKKVVLGKTDGTRWHELALVDHPVESGRWYTLRIDAVDDRIQVFVDEELKVNARDRDYARGMVGVRVVDTHARFDDIQVSPPPHDHRPVTSRPAAGLQWIRVAGDGRGFVQEPSGQSFTPWGLNYDHDESLRLLEDYWIPEWTKVEEGFRDMKALGANVVRIHLQLGRFMQDSDTANEQALAQLSRLLVLAEQVGLYLDITGLGCYRKSDVPAWYDALSESERWKVQARFWEEVARRAATSPAVFCYNLMNEPVVPAEPRSPGDWLGPAFAETYHYVQFISLDPAGRPRPEIARRWIRELSAAIRRHDRRHLITVGLVDWSLDRPGLSSGFVPTEVGRELDFLCVHLYPGSGKVTEALSTLAGFSIGKPIVIEETFPLLCSAEEHGRFIQESRGLACGWIGFYWGKPPEELRRSSDASDRLMLAWLERFQMGPPVETP